MSVREIREYLTKQRTVMFYQYFPHAVLIITIAALILTFIMNVILRLQTSDYYLDENVLSRLERVPQPVIMDNMIFGAFQGFSGATVLIGGWCLTLENRQDTLIPMTLIGAVLAAIYIFGFHRDSMRFAVWAEQFVKT